MHMVTKSKWLDYQKSGYAEPKLLIPTTLQIFSICPIKPNLTWERCNQSHCISVSLSDTRLDKKEKAGEKKKK